MSADRTIFFLMESEQTSKFQSNPNRQAKSALRLQLTLCYLKQDSFVLPFDLAYESMLFSLPFDLASRTLLFFVAI